MNWSRTKTILILALLLTNSILLFVLYGDQLGADDVEKLKQEQLKEVVTLLESEEIYVTSEIPEQDYILSDMKLTYEMYDDEKLVKTLLGSNYSLIDERYLSKEAEVRVHGSQELIYRKLNAMGGFVETDLDLARRLADAFLNEKKLVDDSVEHWGSTQLDNGTAIIEYRQVEDGYFVENAYMTLAVAGEEITEFRRKWFAGIEKLDTSKLIESPAKALFRLLPEIDSSSTIERPVKIESMDLGYRLVSNILTINFQEGEPSPYWRFRTSTGEVIYIEAQTE